MWSVAKLWDCILDFTVVKTVHPRMSDGVCGYGLYEGV